MSGPTLRKSLRTWDGVALLIGITIGSGIYSTPYLIAGHLPSFAAVAAAWVGVAAFVLFSGLVYAELGTRVPETGGEFVYIERAFGRRAGFVFGWAQLFIIRTSPAAGLAIVAADYLGYFVPISGIVHTLIALSIIAVLGVFNVVGVRWASLINKGSTVVKVGGLLLFAVAGLWFLGTVNLRFDEVAAPAATTGPIGHVIAALFLVIFSHTGWDRVGYVAGEMENPRRSMPRTMLIGLGLVFLIYWSVNVVYHGVLGMEGLRATVTPAADVAAQLVGPISAGIIALLAVASAMGSINGTMMASSRVYYAMARDGLLFRSLDYVHPRFRTPSRAVIAHVVWGGVILLVRGSFATIVAGMVFGVLIFYAATAVALWRFRRDELGGPDVYRAPGGSAALAVYFVVIAALLIVRGVFAWQDSLVDLAFIATGIPASFIWLKWSSRAAKTDQPIDSPGTSDPDRPSG